MRSLDSRRAPGEYNAIKDLGLGDVELTFVSTLETALVTDAIVGTADGSPTRNFYADSAGMPY